MELTLNLVWVFVAIAGILVQIVVPSRTVRCSRDEAGPIRRVVAMGCALVILFFVISMTDDLHDQVLVWEESKHSRISAESRSFLNAAPDRMTSPGFLAYIPPVPLPAPMLTCNRLSTRHDFQFLPVAVHESFGGRAPPASLI